jgi:hypothetical protein
VPAGAAQAGPGRDRDHHLAGDEAGAVGLDDRLRHGAKVAAAVELCRSCSMVLLNETSEFDAFPSPQA